LNNCKACIENNKNECTTYNNKNIKNNSSDTCITNIDFSHNKTQGSNLEIEGKKLNRNGEVQSTLGHTK
jgi:hypothetical protein